MKIACIGWGSLIWNSGVLKIRNKWYEDGPILPIEFSRISDDGRVTLIIDKAGTPVRTLWALMTSNNLTTAIDSLKERENVKKDDIIQSVLATDRNKDEIRSVLIKWLKTKQLDAAIWTGLSFSKKTDFKRPSIDFILNHLKNTLDYNARNVAEEYIRKAPKQIDTEYRRKIELEFGWIPT